MVSNLLSYHRNQTYFFLIHHRQMYLKFLVPLFLLLFQTISLRLQECGIPLNVRKFSNVWLGYWPPRSLRRIIPSVLLIFRQAFFTASTASSAVMGVPYAYPMILRPRRSITVARYVQPSFCIGNKESEVFADLFSEIAFNDKKSVDFIKKEFVNLYSLFTRSIGGK